MPDLQADLRREMAAILLGSVDEFVADDSPAVAARVREIVVAMAAVFATGVKDE